MPLRDLPSPPRVLAAILQAASDPASTSVTRLSKLIATDPAFSAEVLRVVQSPLYGRMRITTVQRAVTALGMRGLRNLALCTACRNCVRPEELGGFNLPLFWEMSLRRAAACQLLAEVQGLDPAESFTMGLLLDMGLLALVREQPEAGGAWLDHAGASPEDRRVLEISFFGVPHDEVSGELAEEWGLPEDLIHPLRWHHRPQEAPPAYRPIAELAQRAELLAAIPGAEMVGPALHAAQDALRPLGLSVHEVHDLVAELGRRVADFGTALGLDVGAQPTMEDILQSANRQLAQMNLSYEALVRKLELTIAQNEQLKVELQKRNRALELLSVTDPLTELPNRRAFNDRTRQELGRLARYGGELVMMIGDIDHFKRVNDTWGHEFGDQVLRVIAGSMRATLRGVDFVARIGGEEFAVLLPRTSPRGGEVVAGHLLAAVAEAPMVAPNGERMRVTLSIGVTSITLPPDNRSPTDRGALAARLYQTADAALYRAKRSGRNRVCVSERPVEWHAQPVRSAG